MFGGSLAGNVSSSVTVTAVAATDRLWPGSELQRQRVSPVVALAFALLLSRGVAALAIASARALAKQL
jgi:hypothetical protein